MLIAALTAATAAPLATAPRLEAPVCRGTRAGLTVGIAGAAVVSIGALGLTAKVASARKGPVDLPNLDFGDYSWIGTTPEEYALTGAMAAGTGAMALGFGLAAADRSCASTFHRRGLEGLMLGAVGGTVLTASYAQFFTYNEVTTGIFFGPLAITGAVVMNLGIFRGVHALAHLPRVSVTPQVGDVNGLTVSGRW